MRQRWPRRARPDRLWTLSLGLTEVNRLARPPEFTAGRGDHSFGLEAGTPHPDGLPVNSCGQLRRPTPTAKLGRNRPKLGRPTFVECAP